MIKNIAEASGVACPSFMEYIYKYSLPILVPGLVLVSFISVYDG
jgi:hypothetical protein